MRRIHIQLEGREAMGRLTQAADGAAALLYACALAAGGDASLKDAAETLHMTEEQVQKAAATRPHRRRALKFQYRRASF